MFCKILKKDLKKDMRWLWILFVATIAAAGLSRGCKALGENLMFFKILGIFFDSVFYSLAVNVILQPFLRNMFNFNKSFYSDEAYLTHTLPVTKKQLITSKFLTALIEIILGFICLIISLLIMFISPTFFDTLNLLLSTLIIGKFSLPFVLISLIVLIVVEFLMFMSIIFFSSILAHKFKEKRGLKTFLFTAAFAFSAMTALSVVMMIMLAINGIDLTSATVLLSSKSFFSLISTGIVTYSFVTILFYFLARKEFNKGVNVD